MFVSALSNNLRVMSMKNLPIQAAGCKQLIKWLKKHKVALDQCFFAMEHTGWYTLELCCFLQDEQRPAPGWLLFYTLPYI